METKGDNYRGSRIFEDQHHGRTTFIPHHTWACIWERQGERGIQEEGFGCSIIANAEDDSEEDGDMTLVSKKFNDFIRRKVTSSRRFEKDVKGKEDKRDSI